jgi:predicted nuclease of predicted toxin-antitoxin system
VFSAFERARGASDSELLMRAAAEGRILITNDRDFGDRIVRDGFPHAGVILLRLRDERPNQKIAALQRVLDQYSNRISGRFVVVTEGTIRVTSH